MFYNYIKPKIAIAVHGEPMHLLEHQKIARSCGIKSTAKGKNGIILRITEQKAEKIGQIDIKTFVVDGKRLLSTKSEILKAREKMEEIGVVCINLLVNTKYKLVKDPVIFTPGGYDLSKDKVTKEILIEDITKDYREALKQINITIRTKKNKFATDAEKENFLSQKVKATINRIYLEDLGKKPFIEVVFSKISVEKISNL